MEPNPQQEKLTIRNFAGLSQVDIDLGPITLLIGPQAAGKSVIAKLAYYFKSFIQKLLLRGDNKSEEDAGAASDGCQVAHKSMLSNVHHFQIFTVFSS